MYIKPISLNQALSIIPDFVVSLEQAKQRISMLQRFVKEMMIPGIDYGLIPRCDNPTLFKFGAISATRSSGMFTQDIEDTDNNYAQSAKNLSTHSTGKINNSNDKSNEITNNVYTSQANFKITKVQQTKLVSIMNERKLLVEDIRIIMNQRYQVTESKYYFFIRILHIHLLIRPIS